MTAETEAKIEEKEFEIKLTEMETGAGAIPITWCLSPDWFESNQIKDYYVLISTYQPTPSGRTAEWRGYAKLSDMMTYVTFLRPGVNRISARIANEERTLKAWMSREGGTWRDDVIYFPRWPSELEEDEKGKWEYNIICPHLFEGPQDHIQVDIPGECFALEPWEFEKSWVNWLWKYKSVDQCEFRKRRMFAYSIQPIIFLVLWVVRMVIMLACLTIGLKGLSWGPILSPLNYETGDVAGGVTGTYFFIKKLPEPFCYLFMPSLPLAILVTTVTLIFEGAGIIDLIIHAMVAALFLPVLFTVVSVTAILIIKIKIGKKFFDAWDRWMEARDLAREQAWAERQRQFQAVMTCSNTKVIRKLSDLPKDKRTVRLKFQGLKSMVCRPYVK